MSERQDAPGRLIAMEAAAKEKRHTLTELLDSWAPLSEEDSMPEMKDLPPEPVEL